VTDLADRVAEALKPLPEWQVTGDSPIWERAESLQSLLREVWEEREQYQLGDYGINALAERVANAEMQRDELRERLAAMEKVTSDLCAAVDNLSVNLLKRHGILISEELAEKCESALAALAKKD